MGEDNKPPSLNDLGERLRAAREHRRADRQHEQSLSGGPPGMSGLGWALRVGVEMVSAIVVGVGIGYGLDWWFGTKPWFLVVFFLLGSAAAMMNVYRSAMGYGLAVGYKKPEKDGEEQESATQGNSAGNSGGVGSGSSSGNEDGER